ncbi:MAG: rRNA pseudouridine synthase [Fimbriimonadaceae bacterium]|nr:rRNA pseudouridine synthase [Chitinophagales bacterium]
MRLNKYLAQCGVAARRKADEFIESGLVKVNGEIVKEMGYKVKEGDEVRYKGKIITPENKVYILLNKPKDFITTADDEKGRKTVMELIEGATSERVYPVGRLDRNTTGLLLLTNDGEVAQKLSHPSHGAKKIYSVELDKPLSTSHLQMIIDGIELEDGIATVDEIAYADPKNNKVIGVMLHAGKNRIVRRIFESLGYKVEKLDRTFYAGLDKKNVNRGKWRFLSEKEIIQLKRMK